MAIYLIIEILSLMGLVLTVEKTRNYYYLLDPNERNIHCTKVRRTPANEDIISKYQKWRNWRGIFLIICALIVVLMGLNDVMLKTIFVIPGEISLVCTYAISASIVVYIWKRGNHRIDWFYGR
jgi:hypothetical protein